MCIWQGVRRQLSKPLCPTGVSPTGGGWSSAAFNYFNQRLVGYQLYAIEHNREPSTSVVSLLDTTVKPTVVINDDIVEKQLAVKDNSS